MIQPFEWPDSEGTDMVLADCLALRCRDGERRTDPAAPRSRCMHDYHRTSMSWHWTVPAGNQVMTSVVQDGKTAESFVAEAFPRVAHFFHEYRAFRAGIYGMRERVAAIKK